MSISCTQADYSFKMGHASPSVHYTKMPDNCIECSTIVRRRQEAVTCDVCERWQHRTCNTGTRVYLNNLKSYLVSNISGLFSFFFLIMITIVFFININGRMILWTISHT